GGHRSRGLRRSTGPVGGRRGRKRGARAAAGRCLRAACGERDYGYQQRQRRPRQPLHGSSFAITPAGPVAPVAPGAGTQIGSTWSRPWPTACRTPVAAEPAGPGTLEVTAVPTETTPSTTVGGAVGGVVPVPAEPPCPEPPAPVTLVPPPVPRPPVPLPEPLP